MSRRNITFHSVGNGNCCLIKIDQTTILIDQKGMEDNSSFELIEPFLRKNEGKHILDVLCISHGDEDHCGGFSQFKEKIDTGELVIGSIWHNGSDRTKREDEADLPEDYLALREEIERRMDAEEEFGNIQVKLSSDDDETVAFQGLSKPEDLSLIVLNPGNDFDEGDIDENDMSLVINLEISGLNILFAGDSSSQIWQDNIIPKVLVFDAGESQARATILVASHHGSYTFFGDNREKVRDEDEEPDNYKAMDYIFPEYLILSAISKFPLSGDESGDEPPHYAAWKWYHKWFRDIRGVIEDDKHPSIFKYTSEGPVRLEFDGESWSWNNNWSPPDGNGNDGGDPVVGLTTGFSTRGGKTRRGGSEYA